MNGVIIKKTDNNLKKNQVLINSRGKNRNEEDDQCRSNENRRAIIKDIDEPLELEIPKKN